MPKHHTVHIYLGQDDAWHTVERKEEGGLFIGGIALVIVGAAGTVLGILMRRTGISF